MVDTNWKDMLAKSEALRVKAGNEKKKSGILLWDGAKKAISEWSNDTTDSTAERLRAEVTEALGGKHRKGDASKIVTVALATRDNGLDTAAFKSLAQAYAEAIKRTKTAQVQAAEDDAAEKAIEALAEEVPNSTSTVEGAAKILLSKGVDGAVVAILDALGAKNEAAHRSFLRAVSTEIAARVAANKPKPAPKKKAGPKDGAVSAASVKKATPKAGDGTTKAKAKAKARPVKKAEVSPKAANPKAEAAAEALADKADKAGVVPINRTAKAKARPVVKRG